MAAETHFINRAMSKYGDRSYNIAISASAPMLGKTHSDNLKQKWSRERSGSGNHMYGVHLTGALNPMYGRKHKDETRKKISARLSMNKGKNHGNYGVVRSDEFKKKLSQSKKGIGCNQDLIGLAMAERQKYYSDMSSSLKNILSGYRARVWKKDTTIEKNIRILCQYIGCDNMVDGLKKEYCEVSECV